MTLFEEIVLESLLNEGVEINDIESSLSAHKSVNLYYHSMTKEDIAEGEREIYPIAYGLSTAGNPVVRAYQPHGDTASSVPSWKLFRLDGIKKWEITDDTFTTRDIPNLRIKHDDGMSVEYKSAFTIPDTGSNIPNMDKKRIDHTPISKSEVDNVQNITNDISKTSPQDTTIKNEPERLDITPQSNHIPIGVNKETSIAPESKPITHTQIDTISGESGIVPKEAEITTGNPTTPLYQQDIEDNEEEYNDEDEESGEEEVYNDADKVKNLMERMDKIN